MFLTSTTLSFYDAFLTLAYPQVCSLCGDSVESRIYGCVCRNCWNSTRVFTSDEVVCWKCGVPSREGVRRKEAETIRCRRCDWQQFEAARACGVYEGALRESALLLKRQPNLSAHLLNLLVEVASRFPLNQTTRIVPVPLHPEREGERGFNQAVLISKAIAPVLGLMVDEQSLVRIGRSHRYRAGLDAKGRRDTVEQAFSVRFPQLIEGENILLVDDVFTTGATVSSCAEVLLSGGARAVYVLTIARPAW